MSDTRVYVTIERSVLETLLCEARKATPSDDLRHAIQAATVALRDCPDMVAFLTSMNARLTPEARIEGRGE